MWQQTMRGVQSALGSAIALFFAGLIAAPATAETIPQLEAVPVPGVQRPYCEAVGTQGVIQCDARWAAATDYLKSLVYEDLQARIAPELRLELAEAEAVWVEFRDTYCQLVSEPLINGSVYDSVVHTCMATVTNDRIADLQSWGMPQNSFAENSDRLTFLLYTLELQESDVQAQWERYQAAHCQFEQLRLNERSVQPHPCEHRLLATWLDLVEGLNVMFGSPL